MLFFRKSIKIVVFWFFQDEMSGIDGQYDLFNEVFFDFFLFVLFVQILEQVQVEELLVQLKFVFELDFILEMLIVVEYEELVCEVFREVVEEIKVKVYE